MSVGFEYLTPGAIAANIPEHARRLCLMASYEREAGISDNVVQILQGLASEFDAMVLLTNTREIGPADMGKLPRHCKVQFVPNQALDFGMWSRVLHGLQQTHQLRRVCLVNDSCTLVGGFAGCFEKARMRQYKFWGITENTEIAHHIQSYFVVAEAEAVPWMLEFFDRRDMSRYVSAPKQTIIVDFEVGLSLHMRERFPLNVMFPMNLLEAVCTKYTQGRKDRPKNYSVCCWDVLIAVGCPLLKRTRDTLSNNDAAILRTLTQ